MDQTTFNNLVSVISGQLRLAQSLGKVITTDLIAEKIDELIAELRNDTKFEFDESAVSLLKFRIGSTFNVSVGEAATSLHNPDLPLWFASKKSDIDWKHWNAYKSMLEDQGRSDKIVKANEEVIDDVLDYSGDPTTPGRWSRKGLVMGNVQSGKTQNYIGLINKAIDCGYKTIILLGGHLNDLRRQTQERVDQGILGKKSKHLIDMKTNTPAPIGVGLFHEDVITVNSGTTTAGDFNKAFAERLGFKLSGVDPVIFTIKKHAGIMDRLYSWIKDEHYLDPEKGKKLEGPLLLIDDEADYASINTKHHKEEVTATNNCIRKLLSLFGRNTYIGYTATPFANIFIDPDDNEYSEEDDLFPSDFMIKIPVPDNYVGQDFYFGPRNYQDGDETEDIKANSSPTVPIDQDYGPLHELKSRDEINEIPESLEDAIRAFVIVIAIRTVRGEKYAHNTMLVNISHLTKHQNKLEELIDQYYKQIDEALDAYHALGVDEARASPVLADLEQTFYSRFDVSEPYEKVFKEIRRSSARINVWAINQSSMGRDNRELDYSKNEANGLCVIVVGGHKLSRGLTLEGLSISYFTRNSKAYDTLMQMCRWFGYRPNYADLCRVYLPSESIRWYAFISSTIRELYQELERMSKRQQRPSEFGLKVREHPGAMIITAKNKLGAAYNEVRKQDLWGQVQRRFRFSDSVDQNRKNVEFADQFIKKLIESRENTEHCRFDTDSDAVILSDISYEDLIHFVEKMGLEEDDLGDAVLIRHLRSMSAAGLDKPKVAVFNQKGLGSPKWMNLLTPEEKSFIDTPYRFAEKLNINMPKRCMESRGGIYSVRSVHLGNPDDEKIFLTNQEREAVRDYKTELNGDDAKPVSFDYICSDGRAYPGLLIYLFAVAIKTRNQDGSFEYKLGHGLNTTLGYSLSFPRPENFRGMSSHELKDLVQETKHSYLVTEIHRRLQLVSPYEEEEEDE